MGGNINFDDNWRRFPKTEEAAQAMSNELYWGKLEKISTIRNALMQ